MNLKGLTRGILLFLCACSLVVLIEPFTQRHVRAQTLKQGMTIAANEYFCDPTIVSPCPAKNRQTIYVAPEGGMFTRIQELTVPGNPEHISIRGHGMMTDIYPEIGSYWTLKSKRYSPAGLAAHPLLPNAGSSTCDNGGTQLGKTILLGYTVYEYETLNPTVRMLQWLAPALNCSPLRREMHWTNVPEPSIQISDSVILGNQPDSIWALPAEMKEASPQDLTHALHLSRSVRTGHSAEDAEQLWAAGPGPKDVVGIELQNAWLKQHPQEQRR